MFHYKKIDPRLSFTDEQENEAARIVDGKHYNWPGAILGFLMVPIILYTIYSIIVYGAWDYLLDLLIIYIPFDIICRVFGYKEEKALYIAKCQLRKEDLLRSGYTEDPDTGERL